MHKRRADVTLVFKPLLRCLKQPTADVLFVSSPLIGSYGSTSSDTTRPRDRHVLKKEVQECVYDQTGSQQRVKNVQIIEEPMSEYIR